MQTIDAYVGGLSREEADRCCNIIKECKDRELDIQESIIKSKLAIFELRKEEEKRRQLISGLAGSIIKLWKE